MIGAAANVNEVQLTESELVAWGERFGGELGAPAIIALEGDLGSGKTTLAKAICRGFGVTGDVTSPTFALVHEYEASAGPVFHLDLYRLGSPSGLTNLGWDEIASTRGLVLVEWAERAGSRMPPTAIRIRLSHVPHRPGVRGLSVEGA